MKFGTVVNCTDGRVQYPVMDYLKKLYDFDFFDAANEAGPLRTLTKNSDKCRLITLRQNLPGKSDECIPGLSSEVLWNQHNICGALCE